MLHTHSAADIVSGTVGVEKVGTYVGIKIVHKGVVDGVNTFNTIADALLSIGTQSGRYAIVVMPGSYSENWLPLIAVAVNETYNVDIIGQSRSGSIITASSGLLHVFRGMSLKSLTIEGTAYFEFQGSNNAGLYECDIRGGGIYINADPFDITIDGILVENGEINLYRIANPDRLFLRNIEMKNGNTAIEGFAVNSTVPLRITNLNISGYSTGIFLGTTYLVLDYASIQSGIAFATDGPTSCSHCKLDGLSTAGGVINIDHSEVTGFWANPYLAAPIRFGNSKISGVLPPNEGRTKVVNCYDANYDPIPNGVY